MSIEDGTLHADILRVCDTRANIVDNDLLKNRMFAFDTVDKKIIAKHNNTYYDIGGMSLEEMRQSLSADSPINYNQLTGVISHFCTDGNRHVPSTSAANQGFLKAPLIAGSDPAWAALEETDIPSLSIGKVASLQVSLDAKEDKLNKGAPNGYASLDANTKINASQLPDFILGQLLYAGTFVPSTALATLTTNAKNKLLTADNTITLTNDTAGVTGYIANQGCFYLASVAGSFALMSFDVGDWLVSTGSGWVKVGNTDAVTGVKGNNESAYRIGNVNLTADNVRAVDKTGDTMTGPLRFSVEGKYIHAHQIIGLQLKSNDTLEMSSGSEMSHRINSSGHTFCGNIMMGGAHDISSVRTLKATTVEAGEIVTTNLIKEANDFLHNRYVRLQSNSRMGEHQLPTSTMPNRFLRVGTANNSPQWSQVGLGGDDVAGVLRVVNGGTGTTNPSGHTLIQNAITLSTNTRPPSGATHAGIMRILPWLRIAILDFTSQAPAGGIAHNVVIGTFSSSYSVLNAIWVPGALIDISSSNNISFVMSSNSITNRGMTIPSNAWYGFQVVWFY